MIFISSQKLPLFPKNLFFFLNFWSYRKSGLIRKIWLILKCMTKQPGEQTIAIHILYNISGSKGNQAFKFGQLIEYKKYFRSKIMQKISQSDQFQNSFCILKKLKASGLQLSFNILRQTSTRDSIKTNCMKFKTIDTEIRLILIF